MHWSPDLYEPVSPHVQDCVLNVCTVTEIQDCEYRAANEGCKVQPSTSLSRHTKRH